MSDFIIQIGERLHPQEIARRLKARSGMQDRPVRIWQFEWGSAVFQSPPGAGYEPFEADGTTYACTGRPRIVGYEHEQYGTAGFGKAVANAWGSPSNDKLLGSLTGMFILAILNRNGFSIVTDLLGSHPGYLATDNRDGFACLGTLADIVAAAAGQLKEIDLVSMGELLVFDQITFPYTTYQRVRELLPGAVHTWQAGGSTTEVLSRAYWEPREPKLWPSRQEISADLENALKSAATEVSRGARHLAVTLSGGRDSRTVLALLKPYQIQAALTFCTRENRETEIAGQVASAAGVKHVLVQREPHFYGKLLERTMDLIGSEVRGVAHGFAIVDFGLGSQYDVIVGGYLSDTLLKDHFMPHAQLERFRKKSLRERLSRLLLRTKTKPRKDSGVRWAASLDLLSPEIQRQVEERRRIRLDKIAEIRPETASEWQSFWPISRQHDVGSAWANNRLLASDELFYFRQVIEVAARLSPADRYAGTVAHGAFNKICGALNSLVNANTGVAASADDQEEGRYFKRLRRSGQLKEFRSLTASDTPWNDVQHSWADPANLLLHSPDWKRYRECVLHSNALKVLDSILSAEGCSLVRRFQPGDDARANMTLIQLGLHIRRILANT